MTVLAGHPRSRLAIVIRVVSAVAVIGSAVAVTAVAVRNHDQVAVVEPQAHETPTPQAPPDSSIPQLAAPPAALAPGAGGAAASVPMIPALKPPAPVAAGSIPIGGRSPAFTMPEGMSLYAPPRGATAPGASIPPTATVPGASVPLAAAAPGTGSPFSAAAPVVQPPCPMGWPAPEKQGGLASLIGLAPLAGPFSSEAFALAPVYQPLLRLVGPVLAEIAPVVAHYQPVIDPLIRNVQGMEAIVLQAILPYYGPYRDQLIAAEGGVAKAIAPVLERAYTTEAASCLVAWQGQLIEQARGGPIRVPSLARPGTIVELLPQPSAPR